MCEGISPPEHLAGLFAQRSFGLRDVGRFPGGFGERHALPMQQQGVILAYLFRDGLRVPFTDDPRDLTPEIALESTFSRFPTPGHVCFRVLKHHGF